jgi:hypothetical protein
MAGKHLNRTTIGPNTDPRAAIVALARDIVERESQALSDAESDFQNWPNQRFAGRIGPESVRAARRTVCKAQARVVAAEKLHEMAVAYAERRAYIFQDAPQRPGARRGGAETAETTIELSGENQAPSDEEPEDTGDQASVTPGNCACIRYAIMPEMGPHTVYGHRPACLLPSPMIDANLRAWWPLSSTARMDGSGM